MHLFYVKEKIIMAYINKNDFSIIKSCQDPRIIDNYFECDDLIAPAISLLNRKGYRTVFCCSGHPYATIEAASVVSIPTKEELGDIADRFSYEFVCDLGKRIPREFIRHGKVIEQMDYFL